MGNSARWPYIVLLSALLFALTAQYPSSDRRRLFDPLLAEPPGQSGFPFNPASLANRSAQPFATTHDFRVLDVDLTFSVFEFITDPLILKDQLLGDYNTDNYAADLAADTSFNSAGIKDFSSFSRQIKLTYINRATNQVLPSIAADMAATPGQFSAATVNQNSEYTSFVATVNDDLTQMRTNTGDILAEVVDELISRTDFLSFYSNADLVKFSLIDSGFGLHFLLGTHAFLRPDLNAHFVADISGIDKVQVSEIDGSALPTSTEIISQPTAALTKVETELRRVAEETAVNVSQSVNISQLLNDNIYQILTSGKVRFFLATEVTLQVGYGLEVIPEFWQIGAWANLQGLLGHDNYTTDEKKFGSDFLLDLVDPQTSAVGFHAGLDLGSSLQLTPWLTWSLLVTDLAGVAHHPAQATAIYWGDFYYPIDLDTGLTAFFYLGDVMNFHLGVEVLDLLDIFLARQRFDQQLNTIDHVRIVAALTWVNTFALLGQYYNREFDLGVELIFQHFRPRFSLGFSPVTMAVSLSVGLLTFSWW